MKLDKLRIMAASLTLVSMLSFLPSCSKDKNIDNSLEKEEEVSQNVHECDKDTYYTDYQYVVTISNLIETKMSNGLVQYEVPTGFYLKNGLAYKLEKYEFKVPGNSPNEKMYPYGKEITVIYAPYGELVDLLEIYVEYIDTLTDDQIITYIDEYLQNADYDFLEEYNKSDKIQGTVVMKLV